ncbi:MAG: hypothetical protein A2Z38_01955 [Planctomycetes bacterium RBG_19FT_COMBO_48_8]|nr:MAG: hypothetical protein A2Z38_01955 [Planctomycetes bacterium RBG_19FT_COMBO_48_8]
MFYRQNLIRILSNKVHPRCPAEKHVVIRFTGCFCIFRGFRPESRYFRQTIRRIFVLTFGRLRAIYMFCFWSLFQTGRKKDFTVPAMEKTREQRAEKRLRYRWHARFALSPKQKPLSGQIVDVSSKGMALLYHNDENCPGPDQLINTNFGVPYFDSGDSFDTVFFNRIGRVCRIDNLTSKVNRIAIQFAEPLFFKPGEQDINDSDAKQRLEAKARLIVNAKEKPVLSGAEGTVAKKQAKVKADNQVKPETEEGARIYSKALARAEERIRSYAEAKAQAEEKLKAEIKARHTGETKLLAEAEKKIRSYAEAKARTEEKAKAETKARAKAEAKAKTEAKLRAKAEKKAETEAEKRAKIEAELREKAFSYAEQLAKVKAEAAREIAGIKDHADDTITKIKAEFKSKSQEKKSLPKKNTRDKAKKSGEGILMDKVDKFITNRNRIF